MLLLALNSSVAVAEDTTTISENEVKISEESTAEMSKEEIEIETSSTKESFKTSEKNDRDDKTNKNLKGKPVSDIYGLTYKENIYPVNLYERYTIDLTYDYYGIEDTVDKKEPATRGSANRFFTNNGSRAYTYEWVTPEGASFNYRTYEAKNTYAGELKEGFNTAQIRIRNSGGTSVNQVVDVPVFLETPYFQILDDTYAIKINRTTDKGTGIPYLSAKDIRRESKANINKKLEEELIFELYDINTQELVPEDSVPVSFKDSSVEDEYARGQRDIIIDVAGNEYTVPDSLLIVSDNLIKEFGDLEEWSYVNYNDAQGKVVNPINNTQIAMPNRGIRGKMDQINGYLLRDRYDFGIGYERGWGSNKPRVPEVRSRTQVATNFGIRDVGPGSLYMTSSSSNWSAGNAFSNWPQVEELSNRPGHLRAIVDNTVTGKYFLKKNRELLQIQVDPTNNVTYALGNGLSRNLNFSTRNYMYNNERQTREFAASEIIDTDYYTDTVPMVTLGKHKGFKLLAPRVSQNNYNNMELSVKIKDENGNWLTDIEKYKVDSVGGTTSNPFGPAMEKSGQEVDSYYEVAGRQLTSAGTDSAFALGTPWKKVGFDEQLISGYDMFLGNEIEYMSLDLDPKEAHIYQDQFDEKIKTDFFVGKLAQNAERVKEGNLEVSYPDGYVDKFFAKTLNNSSITGTYQFDRSHLPKELNNVSGTKITYPLKTIFVNQSNTPLNDLPSNEAFYNLNVYNLGATGDLQRLKKGAAFNKKAKDVVSKPVYLPGHAQYINYVYMLDGKEIEKNNPTLKELGIDEENDKMQYLTVKMTDNHPNENNRSSLIRVPVLVSNDITSKGVLAYGEDFKTEPVDMTKWTDKEIDDFFIKQSKATGFNLDTNPAERIPVEIDRKDVPLKLNARDQFVFKIIAVSPTNQDVKDIKEVTVTVASKIEAQANPQKLPLGKKSSELDLKDFVKEVEASGEIIDKDKYEVTLLEQIPDVVTEKDKPVNIPVEVRLAGDPEGSGERVEVPVSVLWGSSISFGGDEVDGRMGGGAYTLHDGKKPYISAVSGLKKSNDILPINPAFSTEYLKFGWYDLESSSSIYPISKSIDDSQNTKPSFEISALGIDNKQSTLDKWATRDVNYGDIVRGWSKEPEKQYQSQSEKLAPYNKTQDEIYYEVIKTEKGQADYRRLQFNQVLVTEQEIQYDITKKELDTNAKNYLPFKKLVEDEQRTAKVIGFKEGEYPDVSKPNDKATGTIVVEETLATSNKKIHYEVEVPFVAVDGGLSFLSADNLNFGSRKLPDKDVYFAPESKSNKVVIEDSRFRSQEANAPEVKGWVLKAKLESGLHYGEGTNRKDLEGSSIIKYHEKNDITLNESPQEVYTKTIAQFGENIIEWNNETNEGYRLYVRGGTAEKEVDYKATMIYSIDDGPIIKSLK